MRFSAVPPQLTVFGGSLLVTLFVLGGEGAEAQVVPGTGTIVNIDQFEDPNWDFTFNLPKSSKEEDENIRYPLGKSNNGKWFESPKRGTPDVVQTVDTPAGGLPGSTRSLYLRSRDTGVPGRPGYEQAQDDFIMAARPMPVSYSPNFVVRVCLPPWEQWEQRTGVSFGLRAGLQGPQTKEEEYKGFGRLLRRGRTRTVTEIEPFYPGFFIQFNSKTSPQYTEDHAVFVIRAGENGHDIVGPRITQTGWWTLGMSITPDSRVHYYARPGVEDLTARDHITSTLPYGIPCQYFNTIFFNVVTPDNGRSWSTPWIVDDPMVYSLQGGGSQYAERPGSSLRR